MSGGGDRRRLKASSQVPQNSAVALSGPQEYECETTVCERSCCRCGLYCLLEVHAREVTKVPREQVLAKLQREVQWGETFV